MNTYHVTFESEDDWYILHTIEDPSIFSQARTLDEAVLMIRDVILLTKGETDAELRLIVPASLHVDDARASGRFSHPVDEVVLDADQSTSAQMPMRAQHAR